MVAQGYSQKPQTIGNCAFKCVMSFLRANVDETSHRSFKTYMRSRILAEAIAPLLVVGRPVRVRALLSPPPRRAQSGSRAQAATTATAPGLSKKRLIFDCNKIVARDVYRLFCHLKQTNDGKVNFDQQHQALLLAHDAGVTLSWSEEQFADRFDVGALVDAQRARSTEEASRLLAERLAAQPDD